MPKPRRESAGTRTRPHNLNREQSPGRENPRTKHTSKSRSPEKKSIAKSHIDGQPLSVDSLARLDALNNGETIKQREREREKVRLLEKEERREAKRQRQRRERSADLEGPSRRNRERRKRRVVSGAAMEEGKSHTVVRLRGGGGGVDRGDEHDGRRRKKCLWIIIAITLVLLAIIIPVAVVVSRKKSSSSSSSTSPNSGASPSNSNLNAISPSDIPTSAKGTILDPFTWYDTTDFNVTYNPTLVGGLPIMGLNTTYSDSASPNSGVPPLTTAFAYGQTPIRGVNLGGWLALEPFITPSLFRPYDTKLGVVDEYTLTQHLGPGPAAQLLEKHYATFITEQTFRDVAAAGLDHVRIPYSYWAVTTYPDDPYVPKISWRYLLRGIEWARKHGLRVNLDLHAVPGSQNGWNHSGRQGAVGWLNGTDGTLNGQRSLDLHDQLSQFFAQRRYRNVVTIYGLVNEPKMTRLQVPLVNDWTSRAIDLVRKNGITARIVYADGFLGLPNWKGKFADKEGLVLDVHQYVIFNPDQIAFPHKAKIDFACSGWTGQMVESSDPATGFGPTLCGEWSQADTDCAPYLNNVNVGPRWTGQMNLDDPSQSIITPSCPRPGIPAPGSTPRTNPADGAGSSASASASNCDCTLANAPASSYTPAYKKWLLTFALAQMTSFERGWGWFYWTWDTEEAVQWSWKKGLAAGILPRDISAKGRNFNCTLSELSALDWSSLPENY